LWEIGIPNRSASEFYYYEKHNDPETPLQYGLLYPNDITYTIGKSDFTKDWFCMHVPHNTNADVKSTPFSGANSPGAATPRTVVFNLDAAPASGKATLRLEIAGSGANQLYISVNGEPVGRQSLRSEGTIARHGSHGLWTSYPFEFDATKLKAGENTLTLTIPAGPCNNGVLYDYISLELAE
jgi:rhamnogalacturonan endolyase